jgi:hypothetical protein
LGRMKKEKKKMKRTKIGKNIIGLWEFCDGNLEMGN